MYSKHAYAGVQFYGIFAEKGEAMGTLFNLEAKDFLFISNLLHFAFCLFLILYMRYSLNNRNNSHSRFIFKRFILVTAWSLVADMVSYMVDKAAIPCGRLINHTSMFFSVLLTTYVGYLFNKFYDVVFNTPGDRNKKKIAYLTPVALVFFLLIVNLFTGWFFSIDDANVYTRGPAAVLSFFLQYISFGIVSARALIFKRNAKSMRQIKLRNSFIVIGCLFLTFGLLQVTMGGAIALQCLGVTISIFVLFLHFQDDQITHDILTGLNNRYALDAYLEDKVKDYVDGAGVAASLYLLMMDVNYFKTINDNYGHTEGDKALKAVADSLKRVGARYKSTLFLARFGGDEFAAVFESNSERKVKLLCNEFKAELAEAAKEFRYPLKMGVGYALYRGYNMSIESFYEVADKSLYEDKDRVKNAE